MDLGRLDLFFLMFLRVGGLIMSSPLFDRKSIPNIAKIGFCFFISYLFFVEAVPQDMVLVYSNLFTFALICIKELIFGVILGYVSYLFIQLTFTAGQLMDMQMGFGMVSILDVQSNISVPITGNILNIALLLTFFAVNGHHRLIQILYITIDKIPLGAVNISSNIAVAAVEIFSTSFLLAVNIAFPIIAAGLITEISLGLVIRSVPQLNIYSIGFPTKILVGLILIFVTIPIFVGYSSTIFNQMYIALENMFAALMG